MSTFRIDAFFLDCPHCNERGLLPDESPLGLRDGMTYKHTAEWPIIAVCIPKRRWFKAQPEMIGRRDIEIPHEGPTAVLWEISVRCHREKCPKAHAIYTWQSMAAGADEIINGVAYAAPPIECGGDKITANKNNATIRRLGP